MRTIHRVMASALCVVAGALGMLLVGLDRQAYSYPDESRAAARWEYSTATIDAGSLASKLGELGGEGWEVFSIERTDSVVEQSADGKTRLVIEKYQVTGKRPIRP